ncbi:hypothetical protein BX616_003691 [Lobosporangium transversale]|uniref:Uncharacterized protein n=1 Tax=Lobosporangium transversale TaxID=64571 RepID=A0A1Y2GZA7_9FUNG|nr:hypothetical protein BCR41DRAFT_414615 [Lobosporangium transversale]KAF9898713.1 hypothetical protein BX616_003691 [Lobosporangium transversale]ORZ26803.1 hypothetical protein BCR41DRAFT_414615 [Lobosporangium transversale]|eukprot:XP_021884566.1 hypothetical protein BCR41DRAFT_414615 [Lobosporangium transversale]
MQHKSVFEYPELLHVLAPLLSPATLATCLCLNKSICKTLLPYLYHHITIDHYATYKDAFLKSFLTLSPEAASTSTKTVSHDDKNDPLNHTKPCSFVHLENWGHMVHSLCLFMDEDLPDESHAIFLNSDFDPFNYPDNLSQPSFSASSPVREGRLHDVSESQIQMAILSKILYLCPNLRTLQICVKDAPLVKQLEDLQFQLYRRQIRFNFPYLKDIKISRLLKTIAAATVPIPIITNASIMNVMTSASTIKTAHAATNVMTTTNYTAVEHSYSSLSKLVILDSEGFDIWSVEAIVHPRMSSSLRTLHLVGCRQLTAPLIHRLLQSLPNLKDVDFRTHSSLPIIGQGPLSLTSSISLEGQINLELHRQPHLQNEYLKLAESHLPLWSCYDQLEILRISVPGMRVDRQFNKLRLLDVLDTLLEPVASTHVAPSEYFTWFSNQVGHLKRLKVLQLQSPPQMPNIQSLLLTLDTELGLWKDLKSLEVLDVTEIHHHIGLEEVRWMSEHWPSIRMIKGLKRASDIAEPESVRWLEEKRPAIVLES